MISEWPINPDARRPSRSITAVRALGRVARDVRRQDEATTDLFLAPEHRLSDRVRALCWAMRDKLVETVERDLRLFLAPRIDEDDAVGASLSSASVAIALPLLADANALRHPPFAAVLLRRAREAVIGDRIAQSDADKSDADHADAARPLLISDADASVAQAAMALLVADGRRRDRFGEPVLLLDDLPAELAAWLTWRVAAALRHYLEAFHDCTGPAIDASISAAVGSVLAGHDEGRGLNALAARLAARLRAADRVDSALLNRMALTGQIAAFCATLASILRLPDEQVWDVVVDPGEARLATLLRAAGLERADAAAVLLTLNEAQAGTALDAFDACDIAAARAKLAQLALDPEYRSAIAALETALSLAGSGA